MIVSVEAEHGGQPVLISVAAGGDARVSGVCQPLALDRAIEQPAGFIDHLRDGAEVDDGFAIRSEDLTVLRGIFYEHACANRGDFEAAHDVAIAVGTAHQAECDAGGAGGFA
jgi:hypothetical protein